MENLLKRVGFRKETLDKGVKVVVLVGHVGKDGREETGVTYPVSYLFTTFQTESG